MTAVFLMTQDSGLRTQSHPRRFLASSLPSPLLLSSLRPLDSGGALPDSIRQAAPDRGRKNPACAAGGFTLIETALAMLAIGLGLLAVFGLGRLGLQSAKETGHDRRCVMMADAVFETLREHNARFVDEARTNGMAGTSWVVLWQQAFQDKIPFPLIAGMSEAIPALHFWQSDEITGFEKRLVAATPAFDPNMIRLSDWNPRYILYLSGEAASPVAQAVNACQITLWIFPDGDTLSSDPRIFSTTLINPGGLP